MKTRMLVAGGAVAAGTLAARRLTDRRRAAAVQRELDEPGPEVQLRGARFRLPVAYHRSDGFEAILGADLGRIRDTLPTDALHPVRLSGDRAAVLVGAYRYHDVTMRTAGGETVAIPPYGEVLIGALVTTRPAPPILPLLAPARFGTGGFVMALPVTTRVACDGGRAWWGLPKFVADMDFLDDEAERTLLLEEGDRRVLSLTVRPGGRLATDLTPTRVYGVLDGTLLEVAMPGIAVRREQYGPAGGTVALGDHPVADELRRLGVRGRPLATTTVLAWRFVLPAGRAIGPARPYRGYEGVEREMGRYTVRHSGTQPTDQYANRSPDAWWPGGAPERVPPTPAMRATPEPVDRGTVTPGR